MSLNLKYVSTLSNGIKHCSLGGSKGMATLREVSNIAKITKSMKMIASTKLSKAQRAMNNAKYFGQTSQILMDKSETKLPDNPEIVYVTASSDKGLCGGIHSSVSKFTKKAILKNQNANIFVLGDKAKAQLSRAVKKNIKFHYNQIGKQVPTYSEASSIAQSILNSDVKFDCVEIIYNKFQSVIAYEASVIKAYSQPVMESASGFDAYELDDQSISQNYNEFLFANAIYWALVEGHASEMAAKRTAMENATKNADEMISKLTMTYNRGRQAVITNELIDIIVGASAL